MSMKIRVQAYKNVSLYQTLFVHLAEFLKRENNMNELQSTVNLTQKFYLHEPTGDRVVLNPFEQERSVLNPHGFVDMQPTFELFKALYEEAEHENFDAHFANNRNYLTVSSKYQPNLQASISLVEFTYGSIRQVPSLNDQEPIVRETVLGTLTCAYYRKSDLISVVLAKDGKGNALLPQSFLRSVNVNGILGLPRKEFENKPILSLV